MKELPKGYPRAAPTPTANGGNEWLGCVAVLLCLVCAATVARARLPRR